MWALKRRGFYFDEHGHLAATDPSLDFYDISITKNVASLFISVVILFGVFLTVAKRYKQDPLTSPRGIQRFLNPLSCLSGMK